MVRRALIERRPWLLASIALAIVWWLAIERSSVPGAYQMVLKGAPVGLLAIYAWQRGLGEDGMMVAAVMALAALGDLLTTLEYSWGGFGHAASNLVAIVLYWRNHRRGVKGSVMTFAVTLVIAAPVLAYVLMDDVLGQGAIAAYAALLAITVAMAWGSRFPRRRVGLGALLYLASDLMLVASQGPLQDEAWAVLPIWPLYYAGQLLIVTGVIRMLRADRGLHRPAAIQPARAV